MWRPLVVEGRDADRFVHWTVLGIADAAGTEAAGCRPARSRSRTASASRAGPCPPEGEHPHRYPFALYATDASLGLGKDSSPDEVRAALSDHAIARRTLTGRFGR